MNSSFAQKLFAALLLSFLVVQCKNHELEESAQENINTLDNLLEEIDAFQRSSSPQDSLYGGFHLRGKFASLSPEYFAQQQAAYEGFLKRIEEYNPETESDKISQKVLMYKLKDQLSSYQFQQYYIPLNAEGGFYNEIDFALRTLPFNSAQDYRDYMHWLPAYCEYIKQNISLMREGAEKGYVLPIVLAKNTIDLVQAWRQTSAASSPFMAPYNKMPESISAGEQSLLQSEMAQLLADEIYPTYEALNSFLVDEYLPACSDAVGVSSLPNGAAYYANRVMHYTTLNISPDSVYNLGLAEVARIKTEMERVKTEANFKGSLGEYIQFLRTDPQFYAKTPEQILHYAAWLSKKAEGQLPKYFETLYRNPFTVKPVPAAIAPNYTAGRYSSGSLAMHTPGEYWVNTYNLPARPLYALPALTLHEAVPGHHLQHAINEELDSLPDFRRQYYISAYGEGWALYCEYLGEEMGMYSTPAEWFGRYTYEMWRACRLVVDVGIHQKGWTRQQAVDFLAENTALSLHEVNTEIDRYIGWPGQALSYKMGELKIKQLRATAEAELGDNFDIRAFHNMLLSKGAVPLNVLDEVAQNWIKTQAARFKNSEE